MSGEDNFLSRWARRKQAAKDAAPATSVAAGSQRGSEPGTESPSASVSPSPQPLGSRPVGLSPEQRVEAEAPGEDGAPEPLPDVSELTAESDISAFLRKGVPEAVRQAALRRVWALDPAIRNFVSPAEYAWDFNNPNSIPGFSSSVTSMDLTGFFSGERSTEPLQTGLTPVEEGRTPADIEAPLLENAAPAVRRESAPTASPQEEGRSFVIVEQPAEEVSDTSPRRHGGALPR